jgi:hypothetical protein
MLIQKDAFNAKRVTLWFFYAIRIVIHALIMLEAILSLIKCPVITGS